MLCQENVFGWGVFLALLKRNNFPDRIGRENMDQKALDMKNICIGFNSIPVLKNIDFSLGKGEVCGLVGKNGAGKSTLLKIIQGLYTVDSGKIEIFGEKAGKEGSKKVHDVVGMIFQELSLIPEMTVLENIFLNNEVKNHNIINEKEEARRAAEFMKNYGIDIHIHEKVKNLGSADKQMVEICKAVLKNKKILLLDEPTASLDDEQAAKLYRMVGQLRKSGISMILITHHLQEIMDNCDSIAVIRDGVMTLHDKTDCVSMPIMIEAMLGKEQTDLAFQRSISKKNEESPALELKEIVTKSIKTPLSLKLYAGEVAGLAGLKGSGRTEVFRAIFGLDKLESGEIWMNGKRIMIHSTTDAVNAGIYLIPESRRFQGLSVDHSIKFNIELSLLKRLTKHFLIDDRKGSGIVDDYIRKVNIKSNSRDDLVKSLSGGNQQKVVISKALATNPKILLMDDPTYGVDVGAKAEIMKIIDQFKMQGGAVLLASSEIEEINQNCNRIIILKGRRLAGEISNEDYVTVTQERLATEIQ